MFALEEGSSLIPVSGCRILGIECVFDSVEVCMYMNGFLHGCMCSIDSCVCTFGLFACVWQNVCVIGCVNVVYLCVGKCG